MALQTQLNHIKRAATSNEAWENLKKVHESRGPVRRAALYKQLYRMKKGTDQTMLQYVNEFQCKVEQLEEVGISIPDELVSIMLLGSMPAKYENFTIAIESRDELPDLESLKAKLIEEEARRGEVYTVSGETSYDNALVTKNKQNNYTKHKQGESVKNKERRFRFSGYCYICKKYRHRASDCRYKNANTSQKQNDALAATVLKNDSRKPNVWYLDSGATTHVCALKLEGKRFIASGK
ncbi:hypothetical protein M0804_002990 [Polistes exclamans]|nr:hypothetical protein M0804_002990 [Polistes exclamans]